MREIREQNRKVSWWLIHYDEMKKEYEKRKAEIIDAGTQLPYILVRSKNISDPTGNKVIKLMDELNTIEAWLNLVEEVEQKLPQKMKMILWLRREAEKRKGGVRGRPSWIPYVRQRYCMKIAEQTGKRIEDVWISRPMTFVEWWNKIVDFAARLAAKRGLVG